MAEPAKYQQIAEDIRQEIQTGKRAAGAAFDLVALKEKYGTTKATLGKALGVLAGEGMVRWDGDTATVPAATVEMGSAAELVARIQARTEEREAEAEEVAVRGVPSIPGVRVITQELDPEAERALKREDVAKAFQESKELAQAWIAAEGQATEAKRALSHKLMDLREMFIFRGHPDWNGQSKTYQMLVALLYTDLGVDKNGQRAVLHHLEDRKRERVPKALWSRFGVEELTRGQRNSLEKKTAQALTSVAETTKATASQVAKGKATGSQLVTLAKHIDRGIAVFSPAALGVMTPKQLDAFVNEMTAAREQADKLIQEAKDRLSE
ncbi:GntR family transcriptional regulator [Streptomyces sp. URMC 124]|uniref:GntR family transcriptional regulator n=1 Tax=Streptomyces sp. URMC 124 TaxID=3423405 RepID=UPI003F1B572A